MVYVKDNPTDTYQQFQQKCKSVNVSDAYYYMRRREVNGSSRSPRVPGTKGPSSRSPLYMKIWSYPSDKIGVQAKEVLDDFIATLNQTKRARFEVIELKSPAVLEVREISK
jgi:hypothetical protein